MESHSPEVLRMSVRVTAHRNVLTPIVLVGLTVLAACSREPGPQQSGKAVPHESTPTVTFRNIENPTGFVGDDACFDCHESEYMGYREHGMSRSYYRLTAANRVEPAKNVLVVDEKSGLRYTVVEKPDGLYQEEFGVDDEGKKAYSLLRRMDFVVGSGTAARTYLTRENGRLFELPLTWYTQKRRWDFSPGYEVVNFRFGRTVPDRCMACHNSYPQSVRYVEGKYTEVPEGIGCERCHGPGELHVAERLEVPEPASDIDDSIVNPAHLPFDLRMDVCQQCHLHTTVSLLRAGREAFGFRPSRALADQIALFAEEDPLKEDGVDVISHADRMKRSRCFVATSGSERPLECTTCHDPHQGFRSLGREYFNDTCVTCHPASELAAKYAGTDAAAEHTPPADCFGCHMPRVEVEDAPHSSFTDHYIRVVREEVAATSVAAHSGVTLVPYFQRDRGTREGEIYEAMAEVVYGRQVTRPATIREGVESLETVVGEDTTYSEAIFLTGIGRQLLGDHQASVGPLETAVRIEPSNPERLNALAQAYELAGINVPVAGRLYRRALTIQPAAADIRVNYGRFLQSQGLLDQAVDEYVKAVEENPWLEVGYYNLGTAYVAQGSTDAAETAFRRAIELNPLYVEAMGNLAAVYAAGGREGEAGALFERAVRTAPEDATALGNLGAFRLNQGREADAIQLLRRAVVARAGFVDAIANLSLAYFRVDDYEMAREYARKALEIDSSNPLARQVLVATE